MQIGGATHIGNVRSRNEDAIGWDARAGIAAVADGLGGHPAGDVASGIAVDIAMAAAGAPDTSASSWAKSDAAARLIRQMHEAIQAHARQQPTDAGLATTIVLAAAAAGRYVVAHVGGSRPYRFGAGGLARLTRDHNAAQKAVDLGALSADQARHSPSRHQLAQALGLEPAPTPDVHRGELADDDLLLLCSDGLTGELADDELEALLRQSSPGDLDTTAQRLVRAALDQGGHDNVSVVLIAGG